MSNESNHNTGDGDDSSDSKSVILAHTETECAINLTSPNESHADPDADEDECKKKMTSEQAAKKKDVEYTDEQHRLLRESTAKKTQPLDPKTGKPYGSGGMDEM